MSSGRRTPGEALRHTLSGLTPARREIRVLRESLDRLRDELIQERERSHQNEERMRTELGKVTSARERLESERNDLLEQLDGIRHSQSFRVGHIVVQIGRLPLSALRLVLRLIGRFLRLIFRGVLKPAARAVARAVRKLRTALWHLRRRLLDGLRSARGKLRPGSVPEQAPPKAKPALTVPQGNEFMGPLTDEHGTTMFLCWGLSAEEMTSLVNEVASLQTMQWDFKPLFVTDSDSWRTFREHGFWFEYIPPAEKWTIHNNGDNWSEFVAERIESIVETYSPDRVVVYEDASKRGALKRGVLNPVVSAGPPVIERDVPQTNGIP